MEPFVDPIEEPTNKFYKIPSNSKPPKPKDWSGDGVTVDCGPWWPYNGPDTDPKDWHIHKVEPSNPNSKINTAGEDFQKSIIPRDQVDKGIFAGMEGFHIGYDPSNADIAAWLKSMTGGAASALPEEIRRNPGYIAAIINAVRGARAFSKAGSLVTGSAFTIAKTAALKPVWWEKVVGSGVPWIPIKSKDITIPAWVDKAMEKM